MTIIGVAGVIRRFGENDIITGDLLGRDAARIRLEGIQHAKGCKRGKTRDAGGIVFFGIPEIMQVTVGEEDVARFLCIGVFARLLLAHQRVLVFGFGFEDADREAVIVQEEIIRGAFFGGTFKIRAEIIHAHGSFQPDVGFAGG